MAGRAEPRVRGGTAGAPRWQRLGRARLSVAALASASVVGLPGPAAQAAPSTTFHLHTEYKSPTGAIVTDDADWYANAPLYRDVDHNPATGDYLGADIRVTLLLYQEGVPHLVVERLRDAPAVFPLLVKVSIDANTDTMKSAALGYDALADTAPKAWQALLPACSVLMSGWCPSTPMYLDLYTYPPVGSLGVIGEILRTDGSRFDARIDFTPAPYFARITYDANGSQKSLTYAAQDTSGNPQTISGFKADVRDSAGPPMQISLSNPAPATFGVCKDSGRYCSNHTGSGGETSGSVLFDASEHTNLTYSESGVTKVNLRLRHLQLDYFWTDTGACADIWDSMYDTWDAYWAGSRHETCGFGEIWMDTTPPGLGPESGALTGTASLGGYSQGFRSGFWAHDRYATFQVDARLEGDHIAFHTSSSGTVSCPAGTTLGEPQRTGNHYRFMTSALCGSLGVWD
ncbi:MAG: hypothetical protein HY775_04355 [Acidobacteria bacterium]|nr:hypothetical protein [Acidobacteriota bacterium]